MKTLVGTIAIFCLLSLSGKAQPLNSTKIHLLNTMLKSAELKTTVDPNNPIRVKPRTWVFIQPVGDSLSFIVDNKSYLLHFEPNRQYYFVIQAGYYSYPQITEKSEREFVLTAATESAKGPEEYTLSKITN